jgi:ATP-dependent helicase HrpB
VVSPSNRPKLILATNVAETSVTIDGVSTVVDSGLFKESGHSPWSGLPTLRAAWVSQASARQRAGRAGRTRPGRCLRLYTQAEFRAMRPYSEPEIRRADLSGTLLLLRGGGARGVGDLPWLEKPPEPAVDAGEDVLRRLGALTAGGEITSLGRAMLRFPAHPRIARILCEAEAADALDTGGLLAAVLEQPERREEDLRPGAGPSRSRGDMDHPSDPLRLADELWSRNVRPAERNHVLRVAQRYAGTPVTRHALGRIEEKEILRILLVGFPDRVARRVKGTRDEVLLCTGGRGILTPGSGVSRAEFLVVIEARESGRAGNAVHITRASAIEPEWLFDLPGASFQEVTDVRWNGDSERVEAVEHFLYGQLVLSERALDPSGCDRAAEVLADQALKAGLKRFFGGPDLDRLLGRLDVLRMAGCEIDAVGERDLESLLRDACRGRSSFRSLEDAGLLRLLVQRLGRDAGRRLGSMAPEEVRLPSGRSLRVVYAPGARPWVEAPLQCFYGMEEGPRIGGRVPVVLHLLGPNRQPAQITDDLGRFWSGTYALVRKDLRGRYPKHFWPDDPAHAPPVGLKRDAGREPAG